MEGPILYQRGNTLPYVPGGGAHADLQPDETDDSAAIPKSVVVDPGFDWEGGRWPRAPWNDTVICEAHDNGFAKLNQLVREDLRGTYAGLASAPALEYLT